MTIFSWLVFGTVCVALIYMGFRDKARARKEALRHDDPEAGARKPPAPAAAN